MQSLLSRGVTADVRPTQAPAAPRSTPATDRRPGGAGLPTVDDAALSRMTRRVTFAVGLAAMAYAVLRYVVAGDVAPAQLPLFVANKAIAFTGAALLAACLALTPLMSRVPRLGAWGGLRKNFGLVGFGLSAIHVLMTMVLMNPAYYAKLYDAGGRMTIQGELALLTGILAFAALVLPAMTSVQVIRQSIGLEKWLSIQKLAVLALALTGLHLVALGLPTWLAPASWPAGLPPITLAALLVVVATFITRRALARRPT